MVLGSVPWMQLFEATDTRCREECGLTESKFAKAVEVKVLRNILDQLIGE